MIRVWDYPKLRSRQEVPYSPFLRTNAAICRRDTELPKPSRSQTLHKAGDAPAVCFAEPDKSGYAKQILCNSLYLKCMKYAADREKN